MTESAVRDIVRYYTREAGVRSLERELSKICRKVVRAWRDGVERGGGPGWRELEGGRRPAHVEVATMPGKNSMHGVRSGT